MRYEVHPFGELSWKVERAERSGARALVWIELERDRAEAVRAVLETELSAWEREQNEMAPELDRVLEDWERRMRV